MDIYSGDLTHWHALGGPDQRIRAFQRPENSGSQTLLQHLLEGGGRGTYPFTTELDAVTTGEGNPNIPVFIGWVISPQGQELIEKTG